MTNHPRHEIGVANIDLDQWTDATFTRAAVEAAEFEFAEAIKQNLVRVASGRPAV